MCSQRRWTTDVFRRFLVEHPVLIHVVRRLVWGAHDEKGLGATFRVAEDGSFADTKDEAFELPEGVDVGVVHRLDLDAATAAAWGQVFGDYEILQPFEQLSRATSTLAEKDRTDVELPMVVGFEVPTGKVLRLDARGCEARARGAAPRTVTARDDDVEGAASVADAERRALGASKVIALDRRDDRLPHEGEAARRRFSRTAASVADRRAGRDGCGGDHVGPGGPAIDGLLRLSVVGPAAVTRGEVGVIVVLFLASDALEARRHLARALERLAGLGGTALVARAVSPRDRTESTERQDRRNHHSKSTHAASLRIDSRNRRGRA